MDPRACASSMGDDSEQPWQRTSNVRRAWQGRRGWKRRLRRIKKALLKSPKKARLIIVNNSEEPCAGVKAYRRAQRRGAFQANTCRSEIFFTKQPFTPTLPCPSRKLLRQSQKGAAGHAGRFGLAVDHLQGIALKKERNAHRRDPAPEPGPVA